MGLTNKVTVNGRRIADGVLRRFRRARRRFVQLDFDSISKTLESCGPFKADLLLVHSSLSACGTIDGGPATVVKALRSWISNDAALAMPTHTWSYPDPGGTAPVYDFASTPSVVGTITNFYWRQPGVLRSLHPSHSLASSGSGAEELCQGHELCDTPCGEGTPYERIVHSQSSVLMFAATMDSYTLFHTAEAAAGVPYLYMPAQFSLRYKDREGAVKTVSMWRQDMSISRRFAATTGWLEEEGLLLRRKLGLGMLLFIPDARRLHERVVKQLKSDPLFLVSEASRPEVRKRHDRT
jgi:aminoglycoside 3-N-acetyltransferase